MSGPSPGTADGALASLAGHALSGRFCAWRGASGQRYVASVYPADPSGPDAFVRTFENVILIAVARTDGGRRILSVGAIERASDRSLAIARGFVDGADEWHVHFLAETPGERAHAVADLASRHLAHALVA